MSPSTSRRSPAHRPLPLEVLEGLPDRQQMQLAAARLDIDLADLKIRTDPDAPVELLATVRTTATLLLTRLRHTPLPCPDCGEHARAIECATEAGVLENRLASIADAARFSLTWRLRRERGFC
jgi:hypothetical protein